MSQALWEFALLWGPNQDAAVLGHRRLWLDPRPLYLQRQSQELSLETILEPAKALQCQSSIGRCRFVEISSAHIAQACGTFCYMHGVTPHTGKLSENGPPCDMC